MDTHASPPRATWRSCHHAVTAIARPYAILPQARPEVGLLRRVLAGLRGLPDE